MMMMMRQPSYRSRNKTIFSKFLNLFNSQTHRSNQAHKHRTLSWRSYGMNPQLQAVVTIVAALLLAGLLFSGALLLEYTNHEELLNKGKRLMMEGKVAWAADDFKKIIEQDASHYEAHLRLGQVLLELGEVEQAEHEFETAMAIKLNVAPQSRSTQQNTLISIASAKLSMIKKHWKEAENTLIYAYEKQPQNLELKEALWVLYQQWGEAAFNTKQLAVAINQWGHALDFVGRYKQEEETQAWLAKGLTLAYQQLEDKHATAQERLVFIETALRKHYSYKLLLNKANIYEHELHQPALALAAYRQAYQAQPQIVGLKFITQLDIAGQAALLAGHNTVAQTLAQEAQWVKKTIQQQLPAGEKIALQINQIERTAEDSETTEWEPKIVLTLHNQSGQTLPYLKIKVLLSSNHQLLCSVTQEVFPALKIGETRQVTLLPEQRYLMYKLTKGEVEGEVLLTLDEEAPISWVLKDKKRITLFPQNQWFSPFFPWEQHPKKQHPTKKHTPSKQHSPPSIINTVPNA
jgi:tetratricopeptide (TPR) repeat protein